MSSKGFRRTMMIILWIVLAFMYIPIIAIIAMSFNATAYGLFPYVFTTKWYTALFTTSNLLPAAWQSIKFAVLVAVSALLIGTMTSYGLQYLAPKTAARLNGLLRLPVIIPWLVMSVSLLLVSLDNYSIEESLSAVITCMNNIGFGVGRFSPSGNLGGLSAFSKIVLCFDMLLGRLEIYPLIMLFAGRNSK